MCRSILTLVHLCWASQITRLLRRYSADYGRIHWTYSRDYLSSALVKESCKRLRNDRRNPLPTYSIPLHTQGKSKSLWRLAIDSRLRVAPITPAPMCEPLP